MANEMKVQCAHTKLVALEELVPNPRNPNSHPDEQIQLLARIMIFQGVRNPIVVSNRSGFITKGHGRLMAAKVIGWAQFPVDYQDYESEAQEWADMVADNKIAELAYTNEDVLKELVGQMPNDFDMSLTGVAQLELERLISGWNADMDKMAGIEPNALAMPGKVVIKCRPDDTDHIRHFIATALTERGFLEVYVE